MASSNNSNRLANDTAQAREKMDNMKYEIANELGVNLKKGYNGDLTSAQNGYVGGYMVKDICPERNREYLRNLRSCQGHAYAVTYHYSVGI